MWLLQEAHKVAENFLSEKNHKQNFSKQNFVDIAKHCKIQTFSYS